MTLDHVGRVEQALEQAGARYRSELYEGASHGYTMSDTAAYNEAAAERHFTELFALLDRTMRLRFRPAHSGSSSARPSGGAPCATDRAKAIAVGRALPGLGRSAPISFQPGGS